MKRLFSMVVVVSMFMGGVIAVIDVSAQGVPQQLQILNGKIDQIQTTLTAIQNSITSGEAWYQILPSAQRFLLVMNGEAVLDLETGLVWERSPSTDILDMPHAIPYCANLNVGGRKGWHLPTIEQLGSLVDMSASANLPKLPAGHPFIGVQLGFYFAAGGGVDFTTGVVVAGVEPGCVDGSCGPEYHWCVRSGSGYPNWPLPLPLP
jgi:hypothetical protein